ncbi:MAG: hypothetical protein HC914_14580 [Chloroflexaceae bacterium]|nr:hypothetical protein [Chloroflexaceae bacterium]
MKRRLLIASGIAGVLLVVVAIAVASPNITACKGVFSRTSFVFAPACYQAAGAARAYYRHLAAGAFVDAARYVAYYETFSDVAPTTPPAQLRQQWVQRVSALQAQGTYVAQIHSVEVMLEDGYPVGVATVTIHQQGQEWTITQHIHFMDVEGWKVQAVVSPGGETALDYAVSGHIDPHLDQ